MNSSGKVIAIDGPAGSGKSTTARLVAAKLGYQYLDTGAMYRALTMQALRQSIAPSDSCKLLELARGLNFTFKTEHDINRVFVNNEEVTNDIRRMDVTQKVSEVSAHKDVREVMVAKQRALGQNGGIVAEGRDTTTVVFPQADLKVYLIASPEVRAHRRFLELQRANVKSTESEQLADLRRRDAFDSGREHSPLTCAPDAMVIDTSAMTIDEQVDKIIEMFHQLAKSR